MTEKDPIEIGRSRRPMECTLTTEEQRQRSDQVHSELEMRKQVLAEKETLEEEAKAKKESGKAVEARIAQLDLRIEEMSAAARTGKETRPVDILKLYDPVIGEVVEKRADTGLLMPLKRAPTAQEWDEIKRQQQPELPGTTTIAAADDDGEDDEDEDGEDGRGVAKTKQNIFEIWEAKARDFARVDAKHKRQQTIANFWVRLAAPADILLPRKEELYAVYVDAYDRENEAPQEEQQEQAPKKKRGRPRKQPAEGGAA